MGSSSRPCTVNPYRLAQATRPMAMIAAMAPGSAVMRGSIIPNASASRSASISSAPCDQSGLCSHAPEMMCSSTCA